MGTVQTRAAATACLLLVLDVACGHRAPEHVTRERWRGDAPTPIESERKPGIRRSGSALAWPLRGQISSGFGSQRGPHRHRGIDIRVSPGTRIRAAAPGRVSFSGTMRGYGKVVIVDHGEGFQTRYAHNRANLVSEGEWIALGAVIAEVGSSGNASTPHLHFEVREAGRARDPLRFLEPSTVPANQ